MVKNLLNNWVAKLAGAVAARMAPLAQHGAIDDRMAREKQLLLQGRQLSWQLPSRQALCLRNIQQAEFSIFSQWGDDGIIQFLIQYLEIEQHSFVEFGVHDYTESNTRFLLMNNNWRGLVMDGSTTNIETITTSYYYWRYDLTAVCAFVTAENINDIIRHHGFARGLGLLHIDIDGNDYWIWKVLDCVSPIIVIIEYNAVFGPTATWTVPYDPAFDRTKAHHSWLYWGASLQALIDLSAQKGYLFIGTNSAGNNAYFVRADRAKELPTALTAAHYTPSLYRESRNRNGQLSYLVGRERLDAIRGCPIYNTRTEKEELI